MNKTHVVISSSTGPLVAGYVDYASLAELQDELNSGPDLRCLAVTDPVTGAVTLVTLTGGPVAIAER